MNYTITKRIIDVIFSFVLLIMLSPFLLLIAFIIKISSRGTILYKWQVSGLNGIPFVSWKFRTMVNDADKLK